MPFKSLFCVAKQTLYKFESTILHLIFKNGHPPGLCVAAVIDGPHKDVNNTSPNIPQFLRDAFLFAVPKSRRTLEKRRNRKFGWPKYAPLGWKPIVPKKNILMCDTCGNDYEANHLCGYCYKQIKLETEEMQTAIQNELKLDPVDKEIAVLYEGEAVSRAEEFWKGKRIVEMKKPRPSWFSANLLQKTTQDTNSSDQQTPDTNIKPSDLA